MQMENSLGFHRCLCHSPFALTKGSGKLEKGRDQHLPGRAAWRRVGMDRSVFSQGGFCRPGGHVSNVASAAAPPSLGTPPVVALPKRQLPNGRLPGNASAVRPVAAGNLLWLRAWPQQTLSGESRSGFTFCNNAGLGPAVEPGKGDVPGLASSPLPSHTSPVLCSP